MAGGDERPRFLTEWVASRLGFDRLADALGVSTGGLYVFPWLVAGLDFVVLSGISYFTTGREVFGSPVLVAIPIGLTGALVLARWVRKRYRTAVQSLPGTETDADTLLSLPTGRFRLGLFVIFYLGNVAQLLTNPAEVTGFVAIHGSVIAWTKYLVLSVGYFIMFADIAALLAAAMLRFPLRVYQSSPELDFSDVHGFAGLYETSRLLQAGGIVYFLGVGAWTAILYAPQSASSIPEVSPLEQLVFPLLWGVGRRDLRRAGDALTPPSGRREGGENRGDRRSTPRTGPEGEAEGLPYLTPRKEDIPLVQQKYLELQQVRSAREYPANVSILEELVFAAAVPLVLQWGLSALVGM